MKKDTPIRVCHISSAHEPFATRIFHKEAKTLNKAGYDVRFIVQHDKNETVDGVRIIALPEPKNRFSRMFSLSKRIYKIALRQKVDAYHFHDPELLPWMLKLKKKTGAKVIYDVHEDIPRQIFSKQWLPKIVRKPTSILVNWIEKGISRKLDYVITATPDIKTNFKDCRVVDIKNYPITLDSKFFGLYGCHKNKDYRKDYCTLIYIGGLANNRGIKEIIQSLQFIDIKYNVRLKLAGKFSDSNFEKDVQTLKEWNRVEFLGWISPEDIVKELSKVDIGLVCLHPLRRFLTSLPIKMFEYMAAELPVIASNFPLWKEIIEENKCGLTVDPLNPKEIARAVEYLTERTEEAKKMGENGRKAVLGKYNWENESKKLLKVYEEPLN